VSLEQLWAGWRHHYVTGATEAERQGRDGGCVFCAIADSGPPSQDNGVVHADPVCLVVLNAYPYASGHLLVLPRRHVGDLAELSEEESLALWRTAQRAVAAITRAYRPDGLNLGANLGRAAGAGIPDHLHLHVLPRWGGDTNFMTTVGGVRVLPEDLPSSWRKLRAAWDG
jgi:ATP adenylyltransferase